jgi:VCBS repeat protein
VALLLAFAGVASGAGVSRAADSARGSLSSGTGAPVAGSELRGIAFTPAGTSWAVGDALDHQTGGNQALIERHDGSGWSAVPAPYQSTMSNGLNSVSMASGGGWAVGYALKPGWKYQPLALRWDGTQWSLASPAQLTGHAYFTGVDAVAKESAWAVGFRTAAGETRRTLIEHASGGTWSEVVSPNDGTSATDNVLTAVSGTPATGLWAVGYRESPTGIKPLVLHYDAALPSPSWVSVSGGGGVPAPGAVETVLTGVSVRTASDVWAVGYYDGGAGKRPLALHWNGSSWSNSPVPGIGMLRQVSAVAPGNVWAVGTYYSATEHRTKTLVVHLDGNKWTTVTSADSAGRADEFIGLATGNLGSMVTFVGRQGASSLVQEENSPSGPVSLPGRAAPPVPPVPAPPGIGPKPNPPAPTLAPRSPVPVTVTDQAPAAGLGGRTGLTWSAAVADFNADGWPDVFVAQHFNLSHLWLNNHDGTFSEADAGYFKAGDRHDYVAADFNADGRPDMFGSIGTDRGTALKSDELYIQQSGGTFADQAHQWFVSDPAGRGRNSTVLDANNDGYPDLFSGTAALRADGLPSPNRLYLNTGHGSMLDSPGMGLDLTIGSRSAHAVDYNGDGWPDLLVGGDVGGLHLYKNDQGRGFTDVSSILGGSTAAVDAGMADVNHDSRPDLITLTSATLAERLQRADGTFAPPQTILTLHAGMSLAIGDVNSDHNPDIYVVGGRTANANAPDYLLLGNATGGFTGKPVPETTVGYGDRVYALDYNRDGLTDFLVLNGGGDNANVPGPIQLLTPGS